MKIKFLFYFFLLVCSGCFDLTSKPAPLTSTGNPCLPGQTCSLTPGTVEENIYTNQTAKLVVTFPETWSVEETKVTDTSYDVVFSSPDTTEKTIATMTLSLLISQPESLDEYLQDEFPTLSITPVSTAHLSGFSYNDQAPGPNGGDLQRYFFLNKHIFVDIKAEIFPSRMQEYKTLLDGSKFTE
ncbi:MAG: hypothetical protein A3I05_03110 [Deltaproteobacteria bacterium RIFCSPLOWO2_02_FULL_44_10]|nr:MAG: hypothetical protein A3C46_09010 [Deltaproteobacteria bacterium RIFCSPHIGHO2_02_FULL_44_16]OGQ46870.1 MAG: hypothetical protein A3I05_03110 [Deltaproteobacteria bacterium RIFCSPLOWO2_02_FULL_44_10]